MKVTFKESEKKKVEKPAFPFFARYAKSGTIVFVTHIDHLGCATGYMVNGNECYEPFQHLSSCWCGEYLERIDSGTLTIEF